MNVQHRLEMLVTEGPTLGWEGTPQVYTLEGGYKGCRIETVRPEWGGDWSGRETDMILENFYQRGEPSLSSRLKTDYEDDSQSVTEWEKGRDEEWQKIFGKIWTQTKYCVIDSGHSFVCSSVWEMSGILLALLKFTLNRQSCHKDTSKQHAGNFLKRPLVLICAPTHLHLLQIDTAEMLTCVHSRYEMCVTAFVPH